MVPIVPAIAKLHHTFKLAVGFEGIAGGDRVPLISRASVFAC